MPEEEWRALVTFLADPDRRNNKTRETRWLGSGIYRCGVTTGEVDEQGKPILRGAVLRTAPHGGTKQKPFQRHYLYRCSARAHLTIRADFTDAYVLDVVAQTVRDPRIATMMHPGVEGLSADRQRRAALEVRMSTIESDYIDGAINAKLYAKATEKVAAEIQEIDERMARALRRSASSDILMATDPGRAVPDAPIDVQRAVLATVMNVVVRPQPRRGAAWNPRESEWSRTAERYRGRQASDVRPGTPSQVVGEERIRHSECRRGSILHVLDHGLDTGVKIDAACFLVV